MAVRNLLMEVNWLSAVLRLLLAMVCGGIIGYERERKGRPAGFRTYILVCLGATLVMMTNQYVHQAFGTSDMVRMGAQVISGIGFLGAGTIMVTPRNQVKGLTTAAGLWACACVGLAIGVGFYEGALLGTAFILIIILGFERIAQHAAEKVQFIQVYIEFENGGSLRHFFRFAVDAGIKVENVDIIEKAKDGKGKMALTACLQPGQPIAHQELISLFATLPDIAYIHEISS